MLAIDKTALPGTIQCTFNGEEQIAYPFILDNWVGLHMERCSFSVPLVHAEAVIRAWAGQADSINVKADYTDNETEKQESVLVDLTIEEIAINLPIGAVGLSPVDWLRLISLANDL